MIIHGDGTKPIYVQIAEWIETEILNGNLQPHEKVYSQYTLADMFTINPATAAKGLNLLFEENIVYNKRGLGKFVSDYAEKIITEKRKNHILKDLLENIVSESNHLNLDQDEVITLLKNMWDEMGD